MTLIETNPFIMYNVTNQCGICNIELDNHKSCSIHDVIRNLKVKVYDALISISNFDSFSINEAPQKICRNCFRNISLAYKFQMQCNKAVENFLVYLKHQQESNNIILIKEECNEEYYKESSPIDSNKKPQDNSNSKIEEEKSTSEEDLTQNNECKEDLLLPTETEQLVLCNDKNPLIDEIHLEDQGSNCSTANEMKVDELGEHEKAEIIIEKDAVETITDDIISPVAKKKKSIKKYKLVECETCHKIVGSNNIREHLKGHSDEKPYSCKICDRRFNRKNNMKKHQAIHDNHRSFLCNVCGKSFNINAALLEHERIHTGVRPYSCKICGKAFTHSYTLKNHYAVHSDEKLFTCEICGKSFGTRKSLTQHSSVHVAVRIHNCKMCGNQFKTTYGLRIHLTNHCKGLF